MNCRKCGKVICVEEAGCCQGHCFGCYINIEGMKAELDTVVDDIREEEPRSG